MNETLTQAVADGWQKFAENNNLRPQQVKYKHQELAYAAGAMAVVQHLFPNPDDPTLISKEIPPAWFVNAMSGRPVFAP